MIDKIACGTSRPFSRFLGDAPGAIYPTPRNAERPTAGISNEGQFPEPDATRGGKFVKENDQ